MNTKSYIFAGIIAAITSTNAMATGENTVTSKSYVDAQDALKQDLITTGMMELESGKGTVSLPTLVSYDDTDNLTGTKYGIVNSIAEVEAARENTKLSEVIPTMGHMENRINTRQLIIAPSGQLTAMGGTFEDIGNNGWLNDSTKGTGLVTKTSTGGVVGERKIFEASDLSGYSALTGNNKSIADISIPTVGAMMSAISSGVSAAAPTGTANTIANYDANGALGSGIATYTGAAAYNSTNDSAKIPTMAGVATYAQAKKVCAGWPDGTTTYDSTHTDANCWLWTLPD